ncbi:MAG: Rid family hydrolase [Acidobacteriota bacterium]|nr:Rid family hydrolase [Acidobacteriota bacterium]
MARPLSWSAEVSSRLSLKSIEADIAAQTNRVLGNIDAVLQGAGCSLRDVVKVTVFMTDLGDFAKMNEAFATRHAEVISTHR